MMKVLAVVVYIVLMCAFIYVSIRPPVRPITQLSEYCRDGKNVITYGHRKMWEINPKTNQLIKCDD